MVKTNSLKPHHISVLHYWNMRIRSARKIHRDTKISLSTISYQLKRLRTQDSLQHRASKWLKIDKNFMFEILPVIMKQLVFIHFKILER